MKSSNRPLWFSLILSAFFVFACGSDSEPDPVLEIPDESVPEIVISDAEFPNEIAQELNFAESTEVIFNPDQGFYRPIDFVVTPEGITFYKVPVTELADAWEIRTWENYLANVDKDWSDKDRRAYEYAQIYHLRFDISALSKANNGTEDLEFSEAVVKDLDTVIKAFSDKEHNVIVRFCYVPGFGGTPDLEPSVEIMQKHIAAISSVLKKYEDTVTAIEAGLVGPWGEMHTSEYAKDGKTIPLLMKTWLDETDGTDIPVLVRTPRHIYQYIYNYLQNHDQADPHIKLTDINSAKIPATDKAYRLSLFNDGYLASGTDYGTYYDRALEVLWAEHLTNHRPYGGEVTVDSSDQKLYHLTNTKYFNTLDEMYRMHLSHLDINYNGKIIDAWNDTEYKGSHDTALYQGKTEYHFLQTHMGYRFVLRASTIALSNDKNRMRLAVMLQNKGFGNVNRVKYLSLIAVNLSTHEVTKYENLLPYHNETDIKIETDISLSPGAYDIYLRMAGEGGRYAIQFANDGLWSKELKSNRIGSITI